MKFLVLALCVCGASAASIGFKPFQPVQQGARAVATAVVNAPEVAITKTSEPVKSVVFEPATKSAVYVDKDAGAAVLRSESEVAPNAYNYLYETENGISAQSSGVLKKVDNSEFLAIQGQYRYIDTDGNPVEVTYIADENGFQPQSNILPVAPEIPAAIARSLEYIATHPQQVVEKKY